MVFAQHNHLNALLNMRDETRKQKKRLMSEYKSMNNSYLDNEEDADSLDPKTT